MGRPSANQAQSAQSAFPEFVVRREMICGFFSPPLPSSTFFDLVNAGKITAFKHLRGFYKLNDSLRRLDLREVPALPTDPSRPSLVDLTRLAFHVMEPDLFAIPSWLLTDETKFALELADADHVSLIILRHEAHLADLPCHASKSAYFAGAIDAAYLLPREDSLSDD